MPPRYPPGRAAAALRRAAIAGLGLLNVESSGVLRVRTATFRAAAAVSLAATLLTGLPATAEADATITCTPAAPTAVGITGGALTQEASTGYFIFGETLAKGSKAGAPDSWRVDIAADVSDHPTLGCASDDPLDTSFSAVSAQ